jgi:hypothetical protein
MKRLAAAGWLLVLSAALLIPAFAAAPVKVAEVAPLADVAAEARAAVAALEAALADPAGFESALDSVKQAGGVLACLGQAIAEHPDNKSAGVSGPHLRDAGLAIRAAKVHADAAAGLQRAKQAVAAEAVGEAAAEHPWNKLTGMHGMMEELNARNSKIRRALRRLNNPEEDSRHASVAAVLSLAMIADTHEVKNAADIPKWTAMAGDYQKTMTALSAAIKAKELDKAKDLFAKSTEACAKCHELFRDAAE